MRSKPKKRLGQNFLFDQNILRKMFAGIDPGEDDNVLEIGSGRGALTWLIAPSVASLITVEIDADLKEELEEKAIEYPNVKLVSGDFLKLDLAGLYPKGRAGIKVIGNIPYYISSPIIEHLFKYRGLIKEAYLTVQKEFARRLVCAPGSKEYGSLSVFAQYYSRPRILFDISKNCFFPRPKVDSSFVQLLMDRSHPLSANEERRFFRITRACFTKRRKTLRNSLSGIVSPRRLEAFFSRFRIDRDIRPEDLSVKDFANLALIKIN